MSSKCLGFCTIHNIIDGTAGEPDVCESDFPRIVKCMADGRNHLPCCERKKIPDVCQVKTVMVCYNERRIKSSLFMNIAFTDYNLNKTMKSDVIYYVRFNRFYVFLWN